MAQDILDEDKNSLIVFVSMEKESLHPLNANKVPSFFYLAGKTIIQWIIDVCKKHEINDIGFLASEHDQEKLKEILKIDEENENNYRFFDFNCKKGITREVTNQLLNFISNHSLWIDGNVVFSETFLDDFLLSSRGKNKNALVKERDDEKEFMGIGYFSKNLLENNITKSKNAKDIYERIRKKAASYFSTEPYEKGKTEFWRINYLWNILDANQELIKNIETTNKGTVEEGVTIIGKVAIEEGARIRSGSYLEGPLYIGKDCDIGPNCYLRKGVSLGKNVRIGNACELKNTIVFDGTHIAHLSYVGDSIVGENCNFGAGTITGNLRLDNKTVKAKAKDEVLLTERRKLGVIMGNNVKTAINTFFMPGVIVGNNSAIGTGVILSRNLPDNTFIYVEQNLQTTKWELKPKKENKAVK